jgi:hypothetical protein
LSTTADAARTPITITTYATNSLVLTDAFVSVLRRRDGAA